MTRNRTDSRKIELRLSYRGTGYFGWQIQPKVKTVQRELEHVLAAVLGHEAKTFGASRTDTGVHAHDQHVTFETHNPIPINDLHRALGHHLPPDIQVLSARQCDPDFNVRHHARGKHYAYFIFNRATATSPFVADLGWRIGLPLDVEAMQAAAHHLIGRQDFRAFQSHRDARPFSETEIRYLTLSRHGDLIGIDVIGAHFLYHMVRNMVGSLVKVGLGKWDVAEFSRRFAAGNRKMMGMTAPGYGLHLFEVFYVPPPHRPAPASRRFVRGLLAWF